MTSILQRGEKFGRALRRLTCRNEDAAGDILFWIMKHVVFGINGEQQAVPPDDYARGETSPPAVNSGKLCAVPPGEARRSFGKHRF